MINAEQLVRIAARQAERLFKKQRQIHPLYHYVKADGSQQVFVPPPWCKTKDAMVALAKSVFETDEAVAYVFLNEIWQWHTETSRKEAEAALDRVGGTLANMPGRTEHVMMMGEDGQGMVFGTMQIHRPAGRQPYLGELKIDRPPAMEGRMVGLLPRRETKQ